ncbi:hypothetical protein KCU91_g142, partial [Aureobasidium melanogenum]
MKLSVMDERPERLITRKMGLGPLISIHQRQCRFWESSGYYYFYSISFFCSLFTRSCFPTTLTCRCLHFSPKSQGCPKGHYPSPVNNPPAPVAFQKPSESYTQLVSASHIKEVRAITEPGGFTLVEVFEPEMAQTRVNAHSLYSDRDEVMVGCAEEAFEEVIEGVEVTRQHAVTLNCVREAGELKRGRAREASDRIVEADSGCRSGTCGRKYLVVQQQELGASGYPGILVDHALQVRVEPGCRVAGTVWRCGACSLLREPGYEF